MTKVIAFTGRKFSGKDTAARLFIEAGYTNIKFADPLKDMLRAVLRVQGILPDTVERMIEGDLKEVPTYYLRGKTPRYAMQTLGTEWGRDIIAQDFWTSILKTRAEQHRKIVVTDLRFGNEVKAVRELGGKIIRIKRQFARDNEFSEHSSEVAIDNLMVDAEIENNGSIEELRTKLREYVEW